MRDRLVPLLAALVALTVAPAGAAPAHAQESQVPTEPVSLGAYGEPLRFAAPAGTTFELPNGRRYSHTIEVRVGPGGDVVVINDLPLDAYVEGLGEMPASWPIEALKAQAVAGRTYAWFEAAQGRWGRYGFDICASTACQVFHGRDVVETPEVGQRWAQAVAETTGEVLVYDGDPILARYFSTSGGATRDNEDVFPSEGPRPYLKGVDDPDDAVSPLHRWEARFTRAQMDAILARGRQLSAVSPFDDIEHLTTPDGGSDQVRVRGRNGEVVTVGASAFRAFVSDVADDLYPDTFPQERADGRRLPTTLPSSRFDVTVTEDEVVITGRGWGHGVGMGQYGARGKAERGLAYDEILAAYYNGLVPRTAPGVPERIRVGLDRDAGDVAIRADGPFRVSVGGTVITDRGLGTWRVAERPDRSVGLFAPAGYGAPLVVSPSTTSRDAPFEIEVVTVETVVNKASELRLEVTDRATGGVVLERPEGVVEAGRHAVRWDLDDGRGAPVAPGTFDVRLVAVDEDAAEAGTPVRVEVRAVSAAGAPASLLGPPPPVPPRDAPPWLAAAIAGALLGAMAGAAVRVRP